LYLPDNREQIITTNLIRLSFIDRHNATTVKMAHTIDKTTPSVRVTCFRTYKKA